ncbi:MAG: thioesterase family protein [Flavobacteriaceae bacterium]|jgi:acyl-CoA thioester hydrolase
MFLKEFEIRWNDLDANRHLANISYLSYASDTRMAFLNHLGISHKKLKEWAIGPVVFNEQLFYFKEVLPDQRIRVSFELKGMSEDGKFFQFEHNYFDPEGNNLARCEMMGGWMDLINRKLCTLPSTVLALFKNATPIDSYILLQPDDTRKASRIPIPLDQKLKQ